MTYNEFGGTLNLITLRITAHEIQQIFPDGRGVYIIRDSTFTPVDEYIVEIIYFVVKSISQVRALSFVEGHFLKIWSVSMTEQCAS